VAVPRRNLGWAAEGVDALRQARAMAEEAVVRGLATVGAAEAVPLRDLVEAAEARDLATVEAAEAVPLQHLVEAAEAEAVPHQNLAVAEAVPHQNLAVAEANASRCSAVVAEAEARPRARRVPANQRAEVGRGTLQNPGMPAHARQGAESVDQEASSAAAAEPKRLPCCREVVAVRTTEAEVAGRPEPRPQPDSQLKLERTFWSVVHQIHRDRTRRCQS
jgi:hypothetical protein